MITLRLYGFIFGVAVAAAIASIILFTETCSMKFVHFNPHICGLPEPDGEDLLLICWPGRTIRICMSPWQSLTGL